MKLRTVLAIGAIAAVAIYLAANRAGSAPSGKAVIQHNCNSVSFQGKRFTDCIAVPGQHQIAMRITSKSGIIYRGFGNLARDIDPADVAFAVNGGMYDTGSRPIGYYVEDGKRLYKMNTRDAGGNFFLKPNGVFFGKADGSWQVMASDEFAETITTRPQFGTQSGPMLLLAGKLHPKISESGTSLKIRNGVGVGPDGRAHFVISDEPVSFGTLAFFMRDYVRARDALFLDGTVSSLWHPSSNRMDLGFPLGPLIVVTRRTESS